MIKQKAQERGRGNKEKSIWRCKYTNKCAFEAKNGCTAYYRGRLIKKGCVCVCVCVVIKVRTGYSGLPNKAEGFKIDGQESHF